MPMPGANFREGATPEVLLPRIRSIRSSQNEAYAQFLSACGGAGGKQQGAPVQQGGTLSPSTGMLEYPQGV